MSIGYYRLPEGIAADIDEFEGLVASFLAGDMAADVFKGRHVVRGIYEQRKDRSYMMRVRVAGGLLDCRQVRELAELSRVFGGGWLHVTTRQDVQLHDVAISDAPEIMRRLQQVGLTSKGGGGNTLRNVTACPYAGVCPHECFDVTSCANAVTESMIALPGSYTLPRKYKIAFSGCRADCAYAQVTDLGFIAEVRDGQAGFRVLAGGGMGARSRAADTLLEWTPAAEVVRVAESARLLFDQHGDRNNRQRARLRYVFERMGADECRRLFDEIMCGLSEDAASGLTALAEINAGVRSLPEGLTGPVLEDRGGAVVMSQRQPGLVSVLLHLPLGVVASGDLARIGELAGEFSRESGVRTTRAQNIMIRSVDERRLPELVAGLRELDADVLTAHPLERFVVCVGAAVCRLGICETGDVAKECAKALAESGVKRETLAAMQF
ncbi:MAG: nitrite/sulfite reductase, partial [Kiritimatiellae bacterium]|nr:nitrite/sulfite reductase [Kiritimatiellia bacterium]